MFVVLFFIGFSFCVVLEYMTMNINEDMAWGPNMEQAALWGVFQEDRYESLRYWPKSLPIKRQEESDKV